MRTRVGRGVAAGVAVGLLLAGCGGSADDPGGAGAEETPTASASPADPSEPAAGEETTEAAPGVGAGAEPAAGEELTTPIARLRVPEGWVTDRETEWLQLAQDPERPFYVTLVQSEDSYGEQFGTLPLDELAENARSVSPEADKVEILDPVTLDGVDFYHIAGPSSSQWTEEYGTSHEGMDVRVSFDFARRTRPEVREQVMASVLATFEWR